MPKNMRHGIVTPQSRAGRIPARVVNTRSRKRPEGNNRIRLDRLLRSTTPKILIKRRLGGIGDVLMTTPLLRAIKELIPNCELTYATDTIYSNGALKDIIEHCPYVNKVVHNGEVNDKAFDYNVDITATGLSRERSGTIPPNRIDMFADEVGVDISSNPEPIYELTDKEITLGKEELEELINSKTDKFNIIAIQARSNDTRRTWSLDRIQELADLLAKNKKNKVLLFDWGHSVERWKASQPNIHLVLDKDMNGTARLINLVDVVICPDSAILHLAGALNKRTVTIFGPIPPESRIDHYPNTTVLVRKLNCHPCWYTPTCRKNTGMTLECMNAITAEEVEEAVYKKLLEDIIVDKKITYGRNLSIGNQDPVILVKRSSPGLGDMLMVTPALAALKAKYPDKKIEVACRNNVAPVLQNNPNIDKISDCESNFNYRRYYMVIDVSSPCAHYESARISSRREVQKSRVEIFAEAMNVREKIRSLVPEYNVTSEETKWAKEFMSKSCKTNKPKIAVGTRSAEIYRDWPQEYNKKLFEELKNDYEIILLDHAREELYENIIDAAGFSIRKAIAILSECDGLITVDTGLLHFASALNIPTVALFGPIDYRPRCKGYSNVIVATANLDCSPCWRNSTMKCKKTGHVKGISQCMTNMKPKQIASIVKRKIK